MILSDTPLDIRHQWPLKAGSQADLIFLGPSSDDPLTQRVSQKFFLIFLPQKQESDIIRVVETAGACSCVNSIIVEKAAGTRSALKLLKLYIQYLKSKYQV